MFCLFWEAIIFLNENDPPFFLSITLLILLGHIHELQIHVPWTRLQSEPIVLTINTIECVLSLPDNRSSSVRYTHLFCSVKQKFLVPYLPADKKSLFFI